MGHRELDWADRFFARWGYLAVFIARLLPVVRTFIALPAGIARMPRGRFHLYTFLDRGHGASLWRTWDEARRKLARVGKYFHKFDAVIGIVLVAGLLWFVWSHWQNRMSTEPSAVTRNG